MTPDQWIVTGVGYAIFVAIATIWSYQRWVARKNSILALDRRD